MQRFQSTPPRGGRHRGDGSRHRRACFNSRPRAGGDMLAGAGVALRRCFNPRPRAGGDAASGLQSRSMTFQSTPPRGGRPIRQTAGRACWRFNPRPRAGGDASCAVRGGVCSVSIHAPARGATAMTLHRDSTYGKVRVPRMASYSDVKERAQPDVYLQLIHKTVVTESANVPAFC